MQQFPRQLSSSRQALVKCPEKHLLNGKRKVEVNVRMNKCARVRCGAVRCVVAPCGMAID